MTTPSGFMRYFVLQFLRLGIVLIISLGLITTFLPKILSSEWGKSQMLNWVNHSIKGEIHIASVQLSWFAGQKIEGLQLDDSNQSSILNIEKFEIEAPLLTLIFKNPLLYPFKLNHLNTNILTENNGLTNLENALGISLREKKQVFIPTTILLKEVNGSLKIAHSFSPLEFSFSGLTSENGSEGFFDMHLSLNQSAIKGPKNLPKELWDLKNLKDANIEVSIFNIPTRSIEQLLTLKFPRLKGHLHALLGDFFNIILKKEPTSADQKLDLEITSAKSKSQIKCIMHAENLSFEALIDAPSDLNIKISGTCQDILTSNGFFNDWDKVTVSWESKSQRISTPFLQSLFKLDNEMRTYIDALFGNPLSFDSLGKIKNISGSLKLSLEGNNGSLNLDSQIKEGILSLNKPLELTTIISEATVQIFSKFNIPLLSAAIKAENPLKLSLDPSFFSTPIFPFNFDQLTLKGKLDLGKIQISNQNGFQQILNFIRQTNQTYSNFWFTPLFFQIKNKVFKWERTDLLVDHLYRLATWGSTNLNNDQTDLTLGIPAETIEYAFNVKGLPSDYVLQLPIRLKAGKIKWDKKKGLAQIASLIAQNQAKSKLPFLGNLVNHALKTPESSQTPLPTTQPFPWADPL